MDRILILSYRADGASYCRGCLMGSTNSSLDMLDTDDKKEAVGFLAKLLLEEETKESGLDYSSRDNYVYVNGISKETFVEDEDVAGKQSKTLAESILLEAHQEFERLLESHKQAEVQAKEAEKERESERQRQADLRQLEDLKKKLGVV